MTPWLLPAVLGLVGIGFIIYLDGVCVHKHQWTFSKALNWWYCESASGWVIPCGVGVLIGHFWTRSDIPPMTGWKLAGLSVFIIGAAVDLARTYWWRTVIYDRSPVKVGDKLDAGEYNGITPQATVTVVNVTSPVWWQNWTLSRGFHWLARKYPAVAWVMPVLLVGVPLGHWCW
jgi:hypothetical protein